MHCLEPQLVVDQLVPFTLQLEHPHFIDSKFVDHWFALVVAPIPIDLVVIFQVRFIETRPEFNPIGTFTH